MPCVFGTTPQGVQYTYLLRGSEPRVLLGFDPRWSRVGIFRVGQDMPGPEDPYALGFTFAEDFFGGTGSPGPYSVYLDGGTLSERALYDDTLFQFIMDWEGVPIERALMARCQERAQSPHWVRDWVRSRLVPWALAGIREFRARIPQINSDRAEILRWIRIETGRAQCPDPAAPLDKEELHRLAGLARQHRYVRLAVAKFGLVDWEERIAAYPRSFRRSLVGMPRVGLGTFAEVGRMSQMGLVPAPVPRDRLIWLLLHATAEQESSFWRDAIWRTRPEESAKALRRVLEERFGNVPRRRGDVLEFFVSMVGVPEERFRRFHIDTSRARVPRLVEGVIAIVRDALHVAETREDPKAVLPEPPLPLPRGVQAPRTIQELMDLGRCEGHCVGSHGAKVLNEETLVVFLRDESGSATAEIALRGSWAGRVLECRGPGNRVKDRRGRELPAVTTLGRKMRAWGRELRKSGLAKPELDPDEEAW